MAFTETQAVASEDPNHQKPQCSKTPDIHKEGSKTIDNASDGSSADAGKMVLLDMLRGYSVEQ